MNKIISFLDGKKTYLAAIATAIAGLYGVSDEVILGNVAGYVNLSAVVLGSLATVYGRYKATQPKKRKPRAKKVTPNV